MISLQIVVDDLARDESEISAPEKTFEWFHNDEEMFKKWRDSGTSDILWQDSSGNVAIWEMNGTAILNQSTSFVANVAGQWSIQLTGDFNGDGMSDILWQDTSGNVAIWEMNGTTILNGNSSFVANVSSQWSIQHLAAE